MAKISDVANWFLAHEEMTHKKVQKLSYYFKGWGLALCDKDFMPENVFQAWIHGPVCPELYEMYRKYCECNGRWTPIPRAEALDDSMFTEEEKDILDTVWQTYGGWNANSLEAIIVTEEPWRKARIGYGEFERCTVPIYNDDMKNYYRTVYRNSQGD